VPQSGRGEKRKETSGAGEVRADADVVVQVVPTETSPELDDEQRRSPEHHHASESPQEVRREDPRKREQRDGPRDAHQRNAELDATACTLVPEKLERDLGSRSGGHSRGSHRSLAQERPVAVGRVFPEVPAGIPGLDALRIGEECT
jgi:hypothetical protein